ncbi:hypothetical protein [Hymenobacter lapidiphilus]|uniref:Uncharacterized protein n=1 Tax=Hymenobacter lapidiphilus TaxID=2608003 RepID=A0A7Y7PQR6_9BACT|nr:hypothetical protein [Hymenobacter lapidiphilus]NVO32223.1 hypothetical protein [Hymenobacter lapidiphilus]
MPRLTLPVHAALQAAVATRFGQPLRYPSHCDALEEELRQAPATGGGRLSPSTLRRFFGLVEKEGGYHLHTLDTLARYAGHADFAAFGQALRQQAKVEASHLTDIPELLAMQQLAYPERLLLGYFLGRITRPAVPTGPAPALALRLAAHPAGQEYYVESFVDLAYLNGAYGQVVHTYLQHKTTPEAQLFGHCALFLGEFLAQDEPAWQQRLAQLMDLPVPADCHAFPHGRRAFAEVAAVHHAAPQHPLPAALLSRLRQQATTHAARSVAAPAALPAFYNLFPAGFHFLVAEALFLTGQYAALGEWVAATWAEVPAVATLENNVYTELLYAFEAVAAHRTGRVVHRPTRLRALFMLDTHGWLLDYYQVHLWLVELHFAAGTAEQQELRSYIDTFAQRHRMTFFGQLAGHISPTAPL